MRIIIGFLVGAGIGAILFIIKEELINTYRYKRLKGKWKQGFSHKYVCSRCEQGTDIESDYCAWCGADMRGEE